MMTHAQAQRVIQARMDGRPVDQNEWTALQRHLETCAGCREYASAMDRLEHVLLQGLRQEAALRWGVTPGPRADIAGSVTARLRRASLHLRAWSLAGAAVLVIALLALLIGGGLLAPVPASRPTGTPAAEPTATPARGSGFQGQAAFVTRQDGNAEIYLLNAGGDPVNLTQNPADDSDPAWSPDGEWLAFLSNRSGKSEVYAMHVSGSRLTQLTDTPDIDWQGPLSWSFDGRRLALIGRERSNPDQRWLYLLGANRGLSAEGPVRVSDSAGALEARFSPRNEMLAYTRGEGSIAELVVLNVESGAALPLNLDGQADKDRRVSAFDWSPDGRSVAYQVEGAPHGAEQGAPQGAQVFSQIRAVKDIIIDPYRVNYSVPNFRIATRYALGAFRAASWGPWPSDLLTYLEDTGQGCWTLRASSSSIPESSDAETAGLREKTGGLCIDAGLERANWVMEGGAGQAPTAAWLLAAGHAPGADRPGLYALRVTDPARPPGEAVRIVRLLDGPEISGAPRLRPTRADSGAALDIDPQPAQPPQAALPAVQVPADLPGTMVAWTPGDPAGTLLRLRPGSVTGQALIPGASEERCAALSPDGARVAFLSDRNSSTKRLDEVYLMDTDGTHARQLTAPRFKIYPPEAADGYPQPFYQCPLWSPDGARLAATLHTVDEGDFLVVIDANGERGDRYVRVHNLSFWNGLAWSPDSRSILAIDEDQEQGVQRIISVDLAQVDAAPKDGIVPASIHPLLTSSYDKWRDPAGMAFSTDGKQMAFLARGKLDTLELYVADYAYRPQSGASLSSPYRALSFRDYEVTGYGRGFSWLPGGRIGLLVGRSGVARVKSQVWLVEAKTGQKQTLLQSEDRISSLAWSPDGQWLAYSSQSGLYLLDVQAAAAGKSGPAWLGQLTAFELDWQK